MIEKKLIINTSARHFCDWLKKVRDEYDKKTYPTEKGYFHLGRAEYKNSFYDTLRMMMIGGAYIYPKDAEQQESIGYPDAVEVYVQELNAERIEITIRSYFSDLKKFIDDLLVEINLLWPKDGEAEDDHNIDKSLSEILSEQRSMQSKLNSIQQAIRTDILEQKEIKYMMAELKKAISGLLNSGTIDLSENDRKILLSGQEIINSNANINSKLELTIPIIPLLLDYKIELEQSTGLDIIELINKIFPKTHTKNESAKNREGIDLGLISEGESKLEQENEPSLKGEDNKEKLSRWQVFIGIFAVVVTILICLFTPLLDYLVTGFLTEKNTQTATYSVTSEVIVSSTYSIEPTITHTKFLPPIAETETTPVPTAIIPPTFTPTTREIITPSPTHTSTTLNSSISIGIYKLKDSCWDEETKERKDTEIIQKLEELGFTDIVPIEIESKYDILKKYDIVYLPHGWYCQFDELQNRVNQLGEFVKNGGGLLIGNPDVSRQEFEFIIFQTTFVYKPSSNITNDFPPILIDHNPQRSIIKNFSDYDFPVPENSIKPKDYNNIYAISKGSNSNGFSFLILDPYDEGRAVFITGGELSESPHPLNEQMWVRIIYWLDHKIE